MTNLTVITGATRSDKILKVQRSHAIKKKQFPLSSAGAKPEVSHLGCWIPVVNTIYGPHNRRDLDIFILGKSSFIQLQSIIGQLSSLFQLLHQKGEMEWTSQLVRHHKISSDCFNGCYKEKENNTEMTERFGLKCASDSHPWSPNARNKNLLTHYMGPRHEHMRWRGSKRHLSLHSTPYKVFPK